MRRDFRVRLAVLTCAVLALALPLSTTSARALSDEQPQPPSSIIEVALHREKPVFVDATPSIVIKPGDSNTTIEEKKRQEKLEQLWRARANATGIVLRDITVDQLGDAIADYLARQGSPLAESAADFVSAANEYGLDPRLMVGISGAESSFGLHMPYGSHNPFGLGPNIYFGSFHDAIYAEAAFLNAHFASRGVHSPHAIGPSYTGTGSQTWGVAVANFMSRI